MKRKEDLLCIGRMEIASLTHFAEKNCADKKKKEDKKRRKKQKNLRTQNALVKSRAHYFLLHLIPYAAVRKETKANWEREMQTETGTETETETEKETKKKRKRNEKEMKKNEKETKRNEKEMKRK